MDTPGTIVVAVGGNALQPAGRRVTIAEQFRHTRESLSAVVALARAGWRIVLVHGNGPQVGDALLRNEMARARVEPLPLGVLVAATAGWIGYMIQQSLENALAEAGIARDVLTLITQTVVDRDDPAVREAHKPIGNVLTDDEVARLRARGVSVGQDGRGRPRRLAPSPAPRDVVGWKAVARLAADRRIVIAGGGGGSPVHADPSCRWEGIDAVVDKDLVAAVLARRIGADVLLILTDVDAVYRDWGTDAARPIARLTLDDAEALLAADQAGAGSMRPKLEAAIGFVREHPGRRAVIAALAEGMPAIRGDAGTTVTLD